MARSKFRLGKNFGMAVLALAISALGYSPAVASSCDAGEVFFIGNSLTQDTLPWDTDCNPEWTIYCGKSLQHIFDNPELTCNPTSSFWTLAIEDSQTADARDQITFQPYPQAPQLGVSTRQQDLDTITYWLSLPLQQQARAVIHTSWPALAEFEAVYHDPNPDHTLTNASETYVAQLIPLLQAQNPGRVFVSTRINEMLDRVYHDIEAGVAPAELDDFDLMYRDPLHLSDEYGRYVSHGGMRQALCQTIGNDNVFPNLSPDVKAYFDSVILVHSPQPSDRECDAVYDAADNCPDAYNPGQADLDGDLRGDLCDNCISTPHWSQSDLDADLQGDVCDEDDGLIYLLFDSPADLRWQREEFPKWNLYSGSLSELRTTGVYTQVPGSNPLADRQCRLRTQGYTDTVTPPAGEASFYLITGLRGHEGTLGMSSSGERPNDNPCP